MKQFYLLLTLCFTASVTFGQNTVTADANAAFIGFANVFETPANGGGFVFNSGWGVEDLKTVVDAGVGTITLQPNFNTYADNPTDPFWVDQTTMEGNKVFEGNTFVEDNTLAGTELTFNGGVVTNTLDPAYVAMAFIKVFNADFSVLKIETQPLVAGQDFSVVFTDVAPEDAVVQYGWFVTGVNANPADEVALGSIVINNTVLSTQDNNLVNVNTFPNPVQEQWNVLAQENITNISVTNVLGQKVLSVQPNATSVSLETGALKTGMYVAVVTTEAGTQTIKIIKE